MSRPCPHCGSQSHYSYDPAACAWPAPFGRRRSFDPPARKISRRTAGWAEGERGRSEAVPPSILFPNPQIIDKPYQPVGDGGPEDAPSGAVLWIVGGLAVWIVTTIIFAASF